MRIRLDKIASCTANVGLRPRVVLGTEIPAVAGQVVAVRVLDDKSTYNQVENAHGRMMTVHKGDLVAGVLGEGSTPCSENVIGTQSGERKHLPDGADKELGGNGGRLGGQVPCFIRMVVRFQRPG